MLKQWVAAIGLPQLIAIGVLCALWLLEQILAATQKVKANSITQVVFNAIYNGVKDRYPLVSKIVGALSNLKPPASALLPFLLIPALLLSGCATIYTPAGASTTQKLKDDLSAAGQVEADVKAQCGSQFAPIGALAMSILSVAEVAGDVAAYNFAGAVQAAITALPALVADGKAVACVVRVIRADYQKLKPKAAPPALTPPPSAALPGYYAMRGGRLLLVQ